MTKSKIVIIGSGSHFTPGLIADLIRTPELSGSTVALVDTDPERLELSYWISQRMVNKSGADLILERTTDRQQALPGADFVITTIAVGGPEAWRKDLDIPRRYGIFQTVGDTIGPGGISRAFRVIPVILEICRDMAELCPNAWLINYANPMTCNCRAVCRETKIKAMGLCHGIFGTTRALAEILGVPASDLSVQAAGINHLTWITELNLRGKDAYPLLRKKLAKSDATQSPVSRQLFETFGLYPSPGDRHVSEFFPHFLGPESNGGAAYNLLPYMIPVKDPGGGKARAKYRAQAEGSEPIDEFLDKESGEKAVAIMAAIIADRGEPHVVNIPNHGAIDDLPDWAVVEIHAQVGARGLQAIPAGSLPQGITDWLQARVAEQELTVEAAVSGDKEVALQAFRTDPLCTPLSDSMLKKMMAELLEAQADYLPQFPPK